MAWMESGLWGWTEWFVGSVGAEWDATRNCRFGNLWPEIGIIVRRDETAREVGSLSRNL